MQPLILNANSKQRQKLELLKYLQQFETNLDTYANSNSTNSKYQSYHSSSPFYLINIFQPNFTHCIHLCTRFHLFILCKRIKRTRANRLTNPTSLNHATSLSNIVWITRVVALIKLYQQLFKAITQLLNLLSIIQTNKQPCRKAHFTLKISEFSSDEGSGRRNCLTKAESDLGSNSKNKRQKTNISKIGVQD